MLAASVRRACLTMIERQHDRAPPPDRLGIVGLVTLGWLSALAGCPGHLSSDFPLTGTGSGGSGSGGSETGSGGAGGDSGDGGGSGGSPAPCDAPKMVFATSCAAMAGCHTAADFLNLTGDDAATRLIGKPEILSPMCAGMNLVNKTPPADGVLFKLLTGTTCGTQMPLPPAAPLTMEQMNCVRDWITSKL
jgi:hypothetical protein